MRVGLRCVTKYENKYYRAEVTKSLPSVTEVSDDSSVTTLSSVKEPLDSVHFDILVVNEVDIQTFSHSNCYKYDN